MHVSDPKQRLAVFCKLEEMSRVGPVALQPKQRRARLNYHKGKKPDVMYVAIISRYFLAFYTNRVYLLCS